MGPDRHLAQPHVWHPIPRLTPGAFMGSATAIPHAP